MKTINRLFGFLFVSLLSISLLTSSCKKNNDGPTWNDDDKETYDRIINLQDAVDEKLKDWLQTMDSLDALEKAYNTFLEDDNVSSVVINSQGIAVQYTNGIRGGLFLRPKDDDPNLGVKPLPGFQEAISQNGLRSLVNKRKMVFINPHYNDRVYYSDHILQLHANNLINVGITPIYFYKNDSATVDHFANLEEYGIIQVYSHGWAWPKEDNITDVYLLTGETANERTSKKYWDDLTDGNIPIMKMSGSENKYFISPEFISLHNDFSNDTILFYGGFCYSFLGGWPDLIESFADGAYVGFDWSVYTFRNANWSVNMIGLMSDPSRSNPMTLGEWMADASMEKSYWDQRDQRTVHIHYTGDANLTLWGDTKVTLIPLSGDGTPVNNPGETGVAYPFRCEVVSDISDREYIWDIGDGSSPVSASSEVNITWSENGNYLLKVDVKDASNGHIIGSASVDVTIGESGNDGILKFVTSCFDAGGVFTAEIYYSPPGAVADGIQAHADIEWSGLSFNGTLEEDVMGENFKYTISGTLSSDAQMVSYEMHTEHEWIVGEQLLYKSDFTLGVQNYPLSVIDTIGSEFIDPFVSYGPMFGGLIDVQQYVTNFEGYEIDDQGVIHTVTGVNWNNVTGLTLQFTRERTKLPTLRNATN